MRGALFVVVVGALGAAALVRSQALSRRDLGVLSPQVAALAADWEAKKVPENGRAVTLILSDVRAAFNPFDAAPDSAGGFGDAAGDWIGRNLIGGDPAAPADTPLIRAFADSKQAAQWTHVRWSVASEAAASRAVEKAILRAHDAGAEIDIVAQGADAAPVLAALRRLEGVERGGQKVGANKVLLLGANAASFKRGRALAAFDPAKIGNVIELAAVWTSREDPNSVQLEILNGKRAGTPVKLDAVWPAAGTPGHVIENTSKVLRDCLESPLSLEETLARQEAVQKVVLEKKAEEDAVKAQAQAAAQAAAPTLTAFKPDPSAALPGAAKKPAGDVPHKYTGPPIPGPGDWPAAPVKEFVSEFNGQPIGWLVSAPRDMLSSLSSETSVRMPDNTPDCKAAMELRAFSIKELGGGDREAAIRLLFEKRTSLQAQQPVGKAGVRRQFGFPLHTYKTAVGNVERTYSVVETETHLIYLYLEVNYGKPENHDACLKVHTPLFQRVADFIRPG